MSGRSERRTEKAGRGAGRPRSAVRPRVSSTSAPVAANVAAARSYHEHAPAPATWRRPSRRSSAIADERVREVAGERRAADLVVDDAELVALAREPQHGGDEVAAVGAEQPGGADDRVRAGRGGGDRVLAGELGAAVARSAARVAADSVYGALPVPSKT